MDLLSRWMVIKCPPTLLLKKLPIGSCILYSESCIFPSKPYTIFSGYLNSER